MFIISRKDLGGGIDTPKQIIKRNLKKKRGSYVCLNATKSRQIREGMEEEI